MPFLTLNPDNSIADVTEIDENATGIEVTPSELFDIARHPKGHAVFEYVGGVIQLSAALIDRVNLPAAKAAKILELKFHALALMQQHLAITDFDQILMIRELFLSIQPTARLATVSLQSIINIWQAGKGGITDIKALTNITDVENYDVTLIPAWPV